MQKMAIPGSCSYTCGYFLPYDTVCIPPPPRFLLMSLSYSFICSCDRVAVLPKAKNIDYRGGDDDDDDAAVPNKGGMAFKLLSRNTKGKVEVRQLLVPEEASMSVNLIKTEAAMRREKQILREKVLSLQEQQVSECVSVYYVCMLG